MPIPSYFNDFLKNIRLTRNQRDDLIRGHRTLRDRLSNDDDLSPIIVSTFLQGSYRRATAVRPLGDKRADVDVIVVTNLDRFSVGPQEALDTFRPFMRKHYKGKYKLNGRSIGIELSYVDLDVVITSAPSEVEQSMLRAWSVTTNKSLEELQDWRLVGSWVDPDSRMTREAQRLVEAAKTEAEWKLSPLWIPDRDAARWEETHPLEQIRWTWNKNRNTNRHYVNVVKAIKWWRRLRLTNLKYPKGYPIEHMIGDCCPDGISSVAEGIVLSLEAVVSNYRLNRLMGQTPYLQDRGVSQNVWRRVSDSDFCSFYDYVADAAQVARGALEAETVKEKVEKWRQLFGDKFPPPPDNNGGSNRGGYTPREGPSIIGGGRFA